MSVRAETLLNILIVFVLAIDGFVALQVFQQRALATDVALPPAVVVTVPVNDDPTTPEDEAEPGAVAVAVGVQARNEVQSAVLASQLHFSENTLMPADSFALSTLVPGPRFVDGVGRAAVGIIGVDRTDATILFVTAVSDQEWICASVDGSGQTTQYGVGATAAAVGDLSSCVGSQDAWR